MKYKSAQLTKKHARSIHKILSIRTNNVNFFHHKTKADALSSCQPYHLLVVHNVVEDRVLVVKYHKPLNGYTAIIYDIEGNFIKRTFYNKKSDFLYIIPHKGSEYYVSNRIRNDSVTKYPFHEHRFEKSKLYKIYTDRFEREFRNIDSCIRDKMLQIIDMESDNVPDYLSGLAEKRASIREKIDILKRDEQMHITVDFWRRKEDAYETALQSLGISKHYTIPNDKLPLLYPKVAYHALQDIKKYGNAEMNKIKSDMIKRLRQ